MRFGAADWAGICVAALIALVVPGWLLWPHETPPAPMGSPIARPQPAPDIAAVGGHQMFDGDAAITGSELPQDAPELAGVIGRPPRDAVALVRVEGGGTRTLAPGESFQGWKLEALSAEAALFTRGPRQIRVPMPLAEPSDASTAQ